MFRSRLFLSIAIGATMLCGAAQSGPIQSPGNIHTLPGDKGTITTPSAGSSRLNGHARAYRMCFWTARHPHAGLPADGYCIAPGGGDPGTPCSCRTEYGVFSGTIE